MVSTAVSRRGFLRPMGLYYGRVRNAAGLLGPAPQSSTMTSTASMPPAYETWLLRSAVPRELADHAYRELRSGRVWGVLVSGRMGSGKDRCVSSLAANAPPSRSPLVVLRFSDPVRSMVNRLVADRQSATDVPVAPSLAVPLTNDERARVQSEAATEIRAMAYAGENSASRSPHARAALQKVGALMQSLRPGWQAAEVFARSIGAYTKGSPVVCADARLPVEVEAASAAGMLTVRLEAPKQVRIDRMRARDGAIPSPASLDHFTETALDEWDGPPSRFDLMVDASGSPEEVDRQLLRALSDRVPAWSKDRARPVSPQA